MLAKKQLLSLLALVSSVSLVVEAVELIELNDANQAILNLELSKGLRAVQNAYKSNFQFSNVAEVKNYVNKCSYVSKAMKKASDADFNGLAQKIKTLLAEPNVSLTCGVKESVLDEFEPILTDQTSEGIAHLSKRKLEQLVEVGKRLRQTPALNVLLRNIHERVTTSLAESLVSGAVEDTKYLFDERLPAGWMEFDEKFKKLCDLSSVKPICKLARRSSYDDITAIGKDFEDLRETILLKQEEKLKTYEQLSGISRDELAANCKSMERQNLKAFQMVDAYIEANFLPRAAVEEYAQIDQEFAFYFGLHQLCKTQL